MYRVKTKMKRGGYLYLMVDARVSSDSDGAGQKWEEVEINRIEWPHGGVVDEKNIADMEQFKYAIIEAAESASQSALEDAMERAYGDR